MIVIVPVRSFFHSLTSTMMPSLKSMPYSSKYNALVRRQIQKKNRAIEINFFKKGSLVIGVVGRS